MADLNNLLGNIAVIDSEEKNDNGRHHGDDDEEYNALGGAEYGDKEREWDEQSHPLQETAPLSEYEEIKRAWMQENACPELLFHDEDLFSFHLDALDRREEEIDEFASGAAGLQQRRPGGAAPSAADRESDQMLASLAANVLRMDCDRVRFVLADLARVRLRKIERHALHNRELIDRMSEQEVKYLQQYGRLLEKHFNQTVLHHLPNGWRDLDAREMIERPNLDTYVFCRVEEDIQIQLDGRKKQQERRLLDDDHDDELSADGDGAGRVQEHTSGSTLIARYRLIRQFVLEGKVTLLA